MSYYTPAPEALAFVTACIAESDEEEFRSVESPPDISGDLAFIVYTQLGILARLTQTFAPGTETTVEELWQGFCQASARIDSAAEQ